MAFKLDVSKFKKVRGDQNSTTLRHPDGHEITVAHTALSPAHRKELHTLPMVEMPKQAPSQMLAKGGKVIKQYATAGDVSQDSDDTSSPTQQPAPAVNISIGTPGASMANMPNQIQDPSTQAPVQAPNLMDLQGQASRVPMNMLGSTSPDLGAAPSATPQQDLPSPPQQDLTKGGANDVASPSAPTGVKVPDDGGKGATDVGQSQFDPYSGAMDAYRRGVGMQQAGISNEAAALGQQGKASAAIEQNAIESQDDLNENYKIQNNNLFAERGKVLQDMANQHIDPNHYLNTMGVAGKIKTGIGLILGGIGGGLTHQSNPALDFLNAQINRDIEGQKMEMGKSMNLLSANTQTMGSLNDGVAMTRINLRDKLAHQLAQEADISQDPLAKARAQQASGILLRQNGQEQAPLAMRQTLMRALQSGNGRIKGVSPEALPPEYRERAVALPSGALAFAPTKEAAEGVRKALTGLTAVSSQLDNMQNFMNTTGRTLPMSDADATADSMKNSVVLELNKLHDLNRLNDKEFETFKTMVSSPGAWRQGKAANQINVLKGLISNKIASEYQNNLEGFNRGAIPHSQPKVGK